MKILITGITGLFGSYLASEFSKVGQIYGLKRTQSDPVLLGSLASKIEWITGDLDDIISLEEAVAGMDLVVHAAGLVSFIPNEASRLMAVNVEGTKNLINAMLEMGISKLIHISSVSALGRNVGSEFIDENITWTDSNLNTPYAISKYLGELEVWRGAQEGLKVLVVYPSVLLGRIADNRSSTQLYHYVLEEKKYYPSGTINFLDVRDAAEMTLQLYQKSLWGGRFILNNAAIKYKLFFEAAAKAFDKQAPAQAVTPLLLRLVLMGAWFGRLIGSSSIPLNRQTAELSQMDVCFSNRKVVEELNFKFRSLSDTLQWAKSNENK